MNGEEVNGENSAARRENGHKTFRCAGEVYVKDELALCIRLQRHLLYCMFGRVCSHSALLPHSGRFPVLVTVAGQSLRCCLHALLLAAPTSIHWLEQFPAIAR